MRGLEIQVADGRVASIRGNPDDVWSRGHLCPKGASLGAIHSDPDRVRAPMIKVDGYTGNPLAHSFLPGRYTGVPGVNTNILSPPTFLDEPSGNGALNDIPVTVAPAFRTLRT